MTEMEAMRARHSVRQYENRPLAKAQVTALQQEIGACNALSGLHIQLVTDEPRAFSGLMARYGKFSGVRNYIALVGKKGPGLDEACGYWGEKLVLTAQMLGLNTCWVALTYKKVPGAFAVDPDEKLALVIALGYGATQGVPHKSRWAFGLLAVYCFALPFMPNFIALAAMQFLGGCGGTSTFSIIMSDAIRDVPGEQRSTAMGFYQSVYAVGIMAGPALMGGLIDAFTITPAFAIVGAVCVVTAAAYPLIRRFAER